MSDLHGAVVLITGAAGGFGQELTRQLLEAGSRLILTDLDETILKERADAIKRRLKLGIYLLFWGLIFLNVKDAKPFISR